MFKRRFITLAVLLVTSFSSVSSEENPFFRKEAKRPPTKVIAPIIFSSKIRALEDYMTGIISSDYNEFVIGQLKLNEISGKHWAVIEEDDGKKIVMRIMLLGLHRNTNVAAVREILTDRVYNTNCVSIAFTSNGRIPLCHFDVERDDLLIMASKTEKYRDKIKLSTQWINPELRVHTEYEKAIGSMIIENF